MFSDLPPRIKCSPEEAQWFSNIAAGISRRLEEMEIDIFLKKEHYLYNDIIANFNYHVTWFCSIYYYALREGGDSIILISDCYDHFI